MEVHAFYDKTVGYYLICGAISLKFFKDWDNPVLLLHIWSEKWSISLVNETETGISKISIEVDLSEFLV